MAAALVLAAGVVTALPATAATPWSALPTAGIRSGPVDIASAGPLRRARVGRCPGGYWLLPATAAPRSRGVEVGFGGGVSTISG